MLRHSKRIWEQNREIGFEESLKKKGLEGFRCVEAEMGGTKGE